jgi:hypothetical protein
MEQKNIVCSGYGIFFLGIDFEKVVQGLYKTACQEKRAHAELRKPLIL